MRKFILTLALLAAGTLSATAACPPRVAESTAGAIAANQQRVICLQQEAAASATQQGIDVQIQTLDSQLQSIKLQQRLDSLPQPPVVVYTPPPIVR